MPNHPSNVVTQEWWQRPTVPGHHCSEPTEQPFPNSLAAEPNAVQGEQPLDPSDDTSPFLNQVFALALDALGIFLLNRRNAHNRGTGTIAGKPSSKDSSHLLGVKPIRLGDPTSTRFEKARRVEY
jgi:hypothetical protein